MSKPMSKLMKWMVAGLALSLAANVFFIGFAIGKRVLGPGREQLSGPPPDAGLNVRSLNQYLSQEEKTAARELLAENRRTLREKAIQIRENERQIRRFLVAGTIDPDELSKLLDRHEKLISETRLTTRRLVLEFVATLDVETRRAVAEDLFKPPRRRPPNDGSRPPRGSRGRDGGPGFERPPPPDEF